MRGSRPPARSRALLAWLLPAALRADVMADMDETHSDLVACHGDAEADRWYRTQVRTSLRMALAARFDRLSGRAGGNRTLLPRGDDLMTGLVQDVRYALRAIRMDLGFFIFATLIIGLGVGANTAVFSIMSPLLLRPLPFDEPDQLVWVAHSRSGGMSLMTSRTSNLRDFREMNRSFESMTGYFAFFDYDSYNLVGDGEPERLVGVGVARNFLEVLGVEPLLGRNFVEEESVWQGRPAAILTNTFWKRRFAADPAIVGTPISLNDTPTEVIGVLPASFDFSSTFTPGTRVDFLLPFPISDETDRWGNTLSMIGRLQPGVSIESAQADIDRMVEQLKEADPERWGLRGVVTALQEQITGGFRSALLVLAAAAGAVMLIACANLSNLLLVRSVKRRKEFALRSVLGARRSRLVRQLFTESLLLALCGAAIGVGIAMTATRLVAATTAVRIPMLATVGVDTGALLFTLALAVGAGLLLGVVPALQISAGHEAAVMNDAVRGSSDSRSSSRARESLVVAEVALACVLLVCGGLLLRSFVAVLDVDLGFQPQGAMSWSLETNRSFGDSFNSYEARAAFYAEIVGAVAEIPGVNAVGLTDTLPLGRNRSWGIGAEGVDYESGSWPEAFPRMVDAGYLQSMRVPLLRGRHFTTEDTSETHRALVINESAAERMWPGQDPIGQNVMINDDRPWQVVGVVADVRHQSLEEASGLEIYLPITQWGDWGTLDMVVRSILPQPALVEAVRATLRRFDPGMPTTEYQTLDAVVDRSVSPRRFILLLLSAFGAAALLLAALGIYAVLAYSVSQRTPEIGIRMALGESAAGVRRRVVGRTLTLAGAGVVLGAIGSLLVARLIGSLLYGVAPTDALTFIGMAIVLMLVSGLAGYLPARRASRTDPMVALRSV